MTLPAFYINIDARTDRRAEMERQLADIGLAVQRLAATTPKDVPPEELKRHSTPEAVHFVGPSHMACWFSHIRAMRAIIESGAPWGLILEDDIVISKALPAFIEAFLAHPMAAELDLVQLETIARRTRVLPAIGQVSTGHDLVPYRSTLYGAAGYLISSEGAKRLLARKDLFNRQNDVTIFTPFMGPAASLRSVLIEPALVIQINKIEASSLSDGNIVAPKRPPAATEWIRWQRRWKLWVEQAINIWDHLKHLPRGISSRVIPFESRDRVYFGAKSTDTGAREVD